MFQHGCGYFNRSSRKISFNPYSPNVTFLYPLKTSENWRFSDVFRGYRNITLGEYGLECSIVRNASAVPSVNMVSKKENCLLKFQGLVDVLFRKKRLSAKSADNCKEQYDVFLEMFNSNTKKICLSLILDWWLRWFLVSIFSWWKKLWKHMVCM